jgi:hypothetical protein
MSSRNDILLDQLAYLIDELEAQRPLLLRIPRHQIEGKPMESVPSLFELYAEMARKEWAEHVGPLAGQAPEPAESESLSEVLGSIQAGRRELIDHLSRLSPESWERTAPHLVADASEADPESGQESVSAFAFQITQSDSTFLRTIAERLHESMITFDR